MNDDLSPNEATRRTDDWMSTLLDDDPAASLSGDVIPGAADAGIDSHRAADLLWLDALLERQYATVEERERGLRRTDRVLAAIDKDRATPAARTEAPAERLPMGRSSGQPRRRWLTPLFTAAAVMLVLLTGWWLTGDGTNAAYAAVEAAYAHAAELVDREYATRIVVRTPAGGTRELEGAIYVRGGEKFAVRQPGLAGDIWLGSDGVEGWLVPAVGRPRAFADPAAVLSAARGEDVPLPDLQLTTLLARLRRDYDLETLPDEELPDEPGRTWTRVRGTLRQPARVLPSHIDLWADAASGAARRLVLDWGREEGAPGPQSATINLVNEARRDDSWYQAATHAAERPLPRRPGILIPLPAEGD